MNVLDHESPTVFPAVSPAYEGAYKLVNIPHVRHDDEIVTGQCFAQECFKGVLKCFGKVTVEEIP